MLTGVAALHLHGLRNLPALDAELKLHMLVPRAQQTQSAAFVTVERTQRMPTALQVRDFRAAPIPRALFDAGRRSPDRRAIRAFTLEAIQRRLVHADEVRTEIRQGQRQWTAILRDVIGEASAGTRSVPEAELRSIILNGGLLEPLWNPRLETPAGEFIAEPDAYFKDSGLAIEVDSRRYHYENADHYETTWRRHGRYAENGIAVLRLIPIDIQRRPDLVLETIRQTIRAQSGKPLPSINVVSRRWGRS